MCAVSRPFRPISGSLLKSSSAHTLLLEVILPQLVARVTGPVPRVIDCKKKNNTLARGPSFADFDTKPSSVSRQGHEFASGVGQGSGARSWGCEIWLEPVLRRVVPPVDQQTRFQTSTFKSLIMHLAAAFQNGAREQHQRLQGLPASACCNFSLSTARLSHFKIRRRKKASL